MSFGIESSGAQWVDSRSNYVYYQRLNSDNFTGYKRQKTRELYAKATSSLDNLVGETEEAATSKIGEAASFFFHLRDMEFAKEKRLLEEKFGKQVRLSYENAYGDAVGKMLIALFNRLLTLVDIFHYHLKLIQNSADEDPVQQPIINLAERLSQKWNTVYAKKILNEVFDQLQSDIPFNTLVENTIKQNIPLLIRDALLSVIHSKDINNKRRQAYGYSQEMKTLTNILRDFTDDRTNALIESVMKVYNLDELSKNLAQINSELNPFEKMVELNNTLKNYKISTSDYDIDNRGGIINEAFGKFLADIMFQVLNKNGSYSNTAETYHIGSSGMKTDMVYTIGIKPGRFEKLLNQSKENVKNQSVRVRSVDQIQKMSHELAKLKNGFIVYTNAKNAELDKAFQSSGFKSGRPISLDTFAQMMDKIRLSASDIIFTVMQLPKGAIGEHYAKQINLLFVRTITTALFDDLTVLKDNKETPNSIHLLYLNGIYFPISYYYDLLGRAFQKVFYDVEKGSLNSDSVKNLVSVSITGTGKILWPTQKEQRNWMNKKANQNKSPWKEQADYTLKNTKILYHFLRSFQDLLIDIFQQGG